MRKNVIAMTIGMLMVLGTASAWACPGGRGGHGHRGGPGMHGKMMEELNLTAEQKKEIDQLHEEMRAEAEPLKEKMRALRDKMHDLWSQDSPDEDAIMALQREKSAIHLQLSELRTEMKLDMMEILTPEQRAKFKEMKGKHKGKRGKHGKKGCGECPHKNAKK